MDGEGGGESRSGRSNGAELVASRAGEDGRGRNRAVGWFGLCVTTVGRGIRGPATARVPAGGQVRRFSSFHRPYPSFGDMSGDKIKYDSENYSIAYILHMKI